jgi:hypothetical protein
MDIGEFGITIRVNKETGAIEVVKNELKSVGDAAQSAGQASAAAGGQINNAFGRGMEHAALHELNRELLQSAGFAGNSRAAIMMLNTTMMQAMATFGITAAAAAPYMAVLGAIVIGISQLVHSHKSEAESLKETQQAFQDQAKSAQDALDSLEKYEKEVKTLPPNLAALRTALNNIKNAAFNQQLIASEKSIVQLNASIATNEQKYNEWGFALQRMNGIIKEHGADIAATNYGVTIENVDALRTKYDALSQTLKGQRDQLAQLKDADNALANGYQTGAEKRAAAAEKHKQATESEKQDDEELLQHQTAMLKLGEEAALQAEGLTFAQRIAIETKYEKDSVALVNKSVEEGLITRQQGNEKIAEMEAKFAIQMTTEQQNEAIKQATIAQQAMEKRLKEMDKDERAEMAGHMEQADAKLAIVQRTEDAEIALVRETMTEKGKLTQAGEDKIVEIQRAAEEKKQKIVEESADKWKVKLQSWVTANIDVNTELVQMGEHTFSELDNAFGQSMAKMIMTGQNFSKTFTALFRQMIEQIISQLIALAAKEAVIMGIAAIATGGMSEAAAETEVAAALGMASGGRVSSPTLAVVGEGGEPETVVPDSHAAAFASGVAAGGGGSSNSTTSSGGTQIVQHITINAGAVITPSTINPLIDMITQQMRSKTMQALSLARTMTDANTAAAGRAV